MHPLRRARRLLAAALTAWPLLAAAQDDCPPPPAPPSAETLALAQGAARDRGFLWRLEKDGRSSWLYGTLHLARLEMRLLFEALLDRIERVELAGEPRRARSTFVGGLKTLPLRIA